VANIGNREKTKNGQVRSFLIMVDWNKEIERLQKARGRAMEMGGPKRVKRQHDLGKLTVRERIDQLIDPGTFLEYGQLATYFGRSPEDEKYAAADGVVTGFAKMNGRLVCLIAEDFTVLGGSVGNTHFLKKLRMMERVAKDKVPIIMLLDGAGARAEQELVEGPPWAPHHGALAALSGLVPLVACILGPCAGDSSLLGALAEFIIMVKGISMLGIAGPPVVQTATGEEISKEDLAGSRVHCYESGVADNEAATEKQCFDMVRQYLSYLPSNAWEAPPHLPTSDLPDRQDEELLRIIPENLHAPYDMKRVIRCIVDENSLFEIKPKHAQNVITALARMDGHSVGLIANQPLKLAGAVDAKAAHKTRHFIDLCNAFHIPIIFLADVPGVLPGKKAERAGTLRVGLSIANAIAACRVPIISIILRKAFGYGGTSMGLIGTGQIFVAAWPSATFSSLPSAGSAAVARRSELESSADPEQKRQELMTDLEEKEGPYLAAGALKVDAIIDPRETRSLIIHHLEVARQRRKESLGPMVKHGIMP
jgi:acetyl-CoA carboxylase carboxyltransferase component